MAEMQALDQNYFAGKGHFLNIRSHSFSYMANLEECFYLYLQLLYFLYH